LCWTAVEVEVEGGAGWCRAGSVGWVGSCEVVGRLAWMGAGGYWISATVWGVGRWSFSFLVRQVIDLVEAERRAGSHSSVSWLVKGALVELAEARRHKAQLDFVHRPDVNFDLVMKCQGSCFRKGMFEH